MFTQTKPRLVALLLVVFAINLAETRLETARRGDTPISVSDYFGAQAVERFERELVSFEFHDKTARWAMYVYSVSYFALLPMFGLAVLVALARREELAPFRVCCLAIAADYFVSLPWFLLFPVPERWAHPGSDAVLLSDQWSSALIDTIRPISALNNSFPSTHVSLSVVIVVVCWMCRVRLRCTVTALAMAVIVATFAIGIHWLADIVAGVITGIVSVLIARRFTDMTERPQLAPEAVLRPARGDIRSVGRLAEAGGVQG